MNQNCRFDRKLQKSADWPAQTGSKKMGRKSGNSLIETKISYFKKCAELMFNKLTSVRAFSSSTEGNLHHRRREGEGKGGSALHYKKGRAQRLAAAHAVLVAAGRGSRNRYPDNRFCSVAAM